VKMVRPGRSNWFASRAAAASSPIVVDASKGEATSRRTVSSLPFQHPRTDCSRFPRALSEAPTSSLTWSPREPEGEASQTVIQLCHRWFNPGFQAECSLVSGPEGPRGEPRFLVDQLLDIPAGRPCRGRFLLSTTAPSRRGLLLGHMRIGPVGSSPVISLPVQLASEAGFGRSWPSSSGHHGVPSRSTGSRAIHRATGWPVH